MKYISAIFSLTILLLSSSVFAEQKIVKGNWDIHYIAFPSSFIEPEVAKNYGLQRSKYNAVVNISVLDNSNNMKAQNAYVTGTAKNLLGQTKELDFQKVTEGASIYYLAELKHRDQENFTIEVKVQLGDRIETISFKKKMYVD